VNIFTMTAAETSKNWRCQGIKRFINPNLRGLQPLKPTEDRNLPALQPLKPYINRNLHAMRLLKPIENRKIRVSGPPPRTICPIRAIFFRVKWMGPTIKPVARRRRFVPVSEESSGWRLHRRNCPTPTIHQSVRTIL
jgi:hypothetical protein